MKIGCLYFNRFYMFCWITLARMIGSTLCSSLLQFKGMCFVFPLPCYHLLWFILLSFLFFAWTKCIKNIVSSMWPKLVQSEKVIHRKWGPNHFTLLLVLGPCSRFCGLRCTFSHKIVSTDKKWDKIPTSTTDRNIDIYFLVEKGEVRTPVCFLFLFLLQIILHFLSGESIVIVTVTEKTFFQWSSKIFCGVLILPQN